MAIRKSLVVSRTCGCRGWLGFSCFCLCCFSSGCNGCVVVSSEAIRRILCRFRVLPILIQFLVRLGLPRFYRLPLLAWLVCSAASASNLADSFLDQRCKRDGLPGERVERPALQVLNSPSRYLVARNNALFPTNDRLRPSFDASMSFAGLLLDVVRSTLHGPVHRQKC